MQIKDFLQSLERRLEDRFFLKKDPKGRWQVWTYFVDKATPVRKEHQFDPDKSYFVHLIQTDSGKPRDPEECDIVRIRRNIFEQTFGDVTRREAKAKIMDNYYRAAEARDRKRDERIERVSRDLVLPYANFVTGVSRSIPVRSGYTGGEGFGMSRGKVRRETPR